MLIKLKHPFTLLIAGPSSCGKTTFVCKLLENIDNNIDEPIKTVHWCYTEEGSRPTIKCAENGGFKIFFHLGIPESFENTNIEGGNLVILDDCMAESSNNTMIANLFTKTSHHQRISVILLTQNIFHKGSHTRDISLNAKYIILFKSPRDKAQASYLCRQIYPENSRSLTDIYKEATEKPYSYLLIDLTQTANDLIRFRSDLFNTNGCICYSNKKNLRINEDKKEEIEFGTGESKPIYSINPTIG